MYSTIHYIRKNEIVIHARIPQYAMRFRQTIYEASLGCFVSP